MIQTSNPKKLYVIKVGEDTPIYNIYNDWKLGELLIYLAKMDWTPLSNNVFLRGDKITISTKPRLL